jgi:Transcriptional regulatory protein, C terminal
MDFRILGPLEVLDEKRMLDVGGGKQRSVLALLLLHANEIVSSDQLIDELWPDQQPPSATKIVQAHVSRLRKAFCGPTVKAQARPADGERVSLCVRRGVDPRDGHPRVVVHDPDHSIRGCEAPGRAEAEGA